MTTWNLAMSRGSRLLAWWMLAAIVSGWPALVKARSLTSQESPGDQADGLPLELKAAWKQAQQAAEKGDWRVADQAVASLLAQVPFYKPARILKGVAMTNLGRAAEGRGLIDDALGANPSPEDLVAVGRMLKEDTEPAGDRNYGGQRIYLNRAFQRAKIQGYEYSDDPEKLSAMAGLGLLLHFETEFRLAVGRLVERFPNRADTHFYRGVMAVGDRDWITADDELHGALELGVPREAVESMLSQGVSKYAMIWRSIHLLPWVALAWVLGLGLLFITGKVLSAATLRSVQTADPNLAVTPNQRVIRRIYRVVVNLTGMYYYVSIPFVIALALAVTVGSVYGVFQLPRVPVKALIIIFCFACAMGMMIWSCIRSLFVRIQREDPGREISEAEAPGLWALAREVADEVGTRPVDVIYLTHGCEMAVFERGRAGDRARDQASRSLIIGLGVVEGFGLDAFRAVLAHEYGHFLHRDTAGGDVALRVNVTMGHFAMSMIQQGNAQWWNVGWQFVRFYHWIFQRITHGASRLQEINADRVAARAYGKGAFEAGLRHVIRRDVALHFEQALSFQRVGKIDEPDWRLLGAKAGGNEVESAPEGLAARAGAFLTEPILPGTSYVRADVRRQIETQVDQIWSAPTTEDDTHPSPVDRVELLERLRIEREERDEPPRSRSAAELTLADLFADPGRLRGEHAQAKAEALRTQNEAHRAFHLDLLKQLNDFITKNPTQHDSVRDRASIFMQIEDYPAAITSFTEAIRRGAAEKGLCHYGRGVAQLELGRLEDAAADFREAMRLDPKLESETADGRLDLGLALLRGGRPREAIPELARAAELEPDRLAIVLRLAEAHIAGGDPEKAAASYKAALRVDPRCAEALAGRSVIRKGQRKLAESIADARAALDIEPILRTTCPILSDLAAFESLDPQPKPARSRT